MKISINNAYANNLKNISVSIPIGKVTGLTGVSGSGKSTLLKEIIGAYGAKNFTRVTSKTIKNSLRICDDVEVEGIENLPHTILIDVKSSITNSASTVSTVSGIHEVLRNLFSEFGQANCMHCNALVKRDYKEIKKMTVDLKLDDKFNNVIEYINLNGSIQNIEHYDKFGNITSNEKKKALSTVTFKLCNVSEKIIHDFNLMFNCRVRAITIDGDKSYDLLREVECSKCHSILPILSRSRLSFNTSYEDGGGSCRCCGGTGNIIEINPDYIFKDKSKSILLGASDFITDKGIKYTTITEKFVEAVFKKLNLNIGMPIKDIKANVLNELIYGIKDIISFKDRVGGDKVLEFKGIAKYLTESYKSGKGKAELDNICNVKICPVCEGTRIDTNIKCFTLWGKRLNNILNMSLNEFGKWCKEIESKVPIKARKYLDRFILETDNFNMLSCGHLTLSRSSNTLSGGELQRIRICALLNSNIKGLCYLLDEPSSGLHYSDIEKLGSLLKRICEQGNTIIMVEHNKKMLEYCDYIVDMGPYGGKNGGTVLFAEEFDKINEYDTATVKALLSQNENREIEKLPQTVFEEYLEFKNLTYNNLKNVDVKFPRYSFTVICGVSGSGKSTFIRRAVFELINRNPKLYKFDKVEYLSQASKTTSSLSTVASILEVGSYIAKIYKKASKNTKECFMLGSMQGKCKCCSGKGILYSETGEVLWVCDQCNGLGFEKNILKVKVNSLNIYDIYNTSMEELKGIIKDKKLLNIIEAACNLGVAYLSFSRNSKSLSKGELQRLSLINVLIGKEKNQLIILDEPSKGLHSSDSGKLVYALRKVVSNNNTLLVVEHNPDLIRNADYIIEFGGTGIDGGYVLFQGKPSEMRDTPTASILGHLNIEKISNKQNLKKNKIVIDDGKTIEKYKPNQLYYAFDKKEMLLMAAKKSRDDFLAVAIPNNSMFSKVDRTIIQVETPIIQTVDFGNKINYDISISDAVGITEEVKSIVSPNNKLGIQRYVFDENSSTGKCVICGGKGKVMAISTEVFIENGELNSACKKFIRNSTDYPKLSKCMKSDKVNINGSLKNMSMEEKNILFWGHDNVYDVEGKLKRWKGIVNYFLEYHRYYPDKVADEIYKSRKEIICPCCQGERLKNNYIHFKCLELTYREWMSLSIKEILDRITLENKNRKLITMLKLLKKIGLEKVRISDKLCDLDSVTSEKIKLISLYLNRIYGIGVVIVNIDMLDDKDKEVVEQLAKDWSTNNTLWIV